MTLAAGQSFGSYEIIKLLGQGGQGEVYLAKDSRLRRPVAIKILSAELEANPEFLARFNCEARLCASLSHPGICTIHEIDRINGQTYISMEYIDGKNLRERIREGPIPLAQALDYAIQIADAMEDARKSNIIHRDIKSANILLTSRNTIKILDFGLAKRLHKNVLTGESEQDTESSITQFGTVRGTVAYMAPEQALGREVDHRSDIFSFGVVLYEMLSGRLPFTGESITEVIDSILHNTPAPVTRYHEAIPENLVRVLAKMLEKDPELRYQSVHEVWVDLRRVRDDTTGSPFITRTILPSKKTAFPWKYVAAGLFAVIALVAAGFLFMRRTSTGPPVPPARKTVSVAVLPFEYKGTDPSRAYLANLVTDGLIAALQPNPAISIAPYATVREFAAAASISEVLKNLNVQWIIRGVVSTKADRIMITPEVFSSDSKSVWKQSLEGGPIEAMDLAAKGIFGALPVSAANTKVVEQLRTPNVEAYQNYLKARDFERGWDVETNLEQAIAHYRKALEQDPDFAAAHAGLANALLTEFNKRNQPELLSAAADASRRAIGLDPNLPEALLAYGAVQLQSGNSIEAQDAFARALQFAPGDDAACRNLAGLYARSGRKQEATTMYERAIALRPSYWLNHYSYGPYQWRYAGDLKAARASFEKATQLHPQGFAPAVMLGNFHLLEGNLEEAEIAFRKALELSHTPYAYNNLGLVHYYRGQYDLALRNWQALLKEAPDKPIYRANVADALRQLNRTEEAGEFYDTAIRAFRETLKLDRTDDDTRSYLSMALAATGHCAEAIRETRDVLVRHPQSPEKSVYAAITASRCGELDWAQQIVLQSIAADNRLTIRFDPDLERLRQRPEIQAALKRDLNKK